MLLPKLGYVFAPGHQALDLTQSDHISRAIRNFRPNLIVNAAAYTAVDQAEKDELAAFLMNAEAPALIAEEAKKIGAAVVHYSTDYVFDGSQHFPYQENQPGNPINVYGKTKLAGEQAIRDAGLPHLIFRTAWVYATRGRNFLLTILRLASQREELRIVSDQFGSPTWCREIARGTLAILEHLSPQGTASSFSDKSGTYHMTAGGVASWYDFANAILLEASRSSPKLPWLVSATSQGPIVTRRVVPISTAEYPTPASRPAFSVLSNTLLERVFGIRLPDWQAQLHEVFTEVAR